MTSCQDHSYEWSELIPGGVVVYYADGDEEILHVNRSVLDLFECRDFEEFMALTGGTFKGFVHASDVESTEDSIWGQVHTRSGLDHIYYQIETATGKILSVDDYGKLVQREGERPVFYVFVTELDRDSVIDWLTGLPGMERFQYVASIEAEAMISRGNKPAILVFDLMGMKTFNAVNGRDEGDSLLRSLASILRSNFGSELCCRYAGDSFCTLVNAESLDDKVARVFEEFSSSNSGNNPPLMAGACELEEGEELPLVLDRAKMACDSDRATWESHLSWFTAEMRREALLRTHVLERLEQALAEGWVRPHYQGIVRSATGRPCCAEALARWVDPIHGALSPIHFISALEESGLLRKLDLHIVKCVVADIASRLRRGLPVIPVSVNLSLRDLVDPDIAGTLARITDAEGVSHDLLRIEFTESAASNDPELLKNQVSALHEAGFEVWMDDFGSGFSSLNVLKEFDFDLIKLDMGFMTGGDDERRRAIIDGVIRSAKQLGVRTLAEGVETATMAKELAAMGCDLIQGFYYFRPTALEELSATVLDADGVVLEPIAERTYWDSVGSVSMADLSARLADGSADCRRMSVPPAGVLECRNGAWHMPRSTGALRRILAERGLIPRDVMPVQLAHTNIDLDDALCAAASRSDGSHNWELVNGSLEYGTGFQFRVMPLDECSEARAYMLASTPTSLGSALGTYGDVPMGYCVLRMIFGSDGEVVDAEYVYANPLFCKWGKFPPATIVGSRLLEIAPEEGQYWLELCTRAAIQGEHLHDVVYGAHAGHWLSYSVTPSLTAGHCIFAFALADAEQRKHQELIQVGTHDSLTGLLNRRGIDEEISRRISERHEEPLVLALLSIDDFKVVNDLYGHDVGDEALRVLARELVRVFPSTAVIGRNGADEALVALFGDDTLKIDTLLACLMQSDFTCELNEHAYDLSISAGYAWCNDGSDLKQAYTRADEALNAVKLAGRAGYRKWLPSFSNIPQLSLLGFTARELSEGMPLAMLAHRPDGEILFANEGLPRLLGYESLADVFEASGKHLRGIVHPDDWNEYQQDVATEFFGAQPVEEFELRLRVVTRDGSPKAVAYRARHIVTHERGEVLYAYLVGEGVTVGHANHMA